MGLCSLLPSKGSSTRTPVTSPACWHPKCCYPAKPLITWRLENVLFILEEHGRLLKEFNRFNRPYSTHSMGLQGHFPWLLLFQGPAARKEGWKESLERGQSPSTSPGTELLPGIGIFWQQSECNG